MLKNDFQLYIVELNIVSACCILYNFLCKVDEVDELTEQNVDVSLSQVHEDDYRLNSHIRDNIANEMWRD